MDVSELNSFQAFEPDKETKAFIYQQVHDLESQIKDLGDITVLIEKKEEKEVSTGDLLAVTFAVTFTIDPDGMNLKVRANGEDVISACLLAKDELNKKLNKIRTFSSSEERAMAIDAAIASNGYLH